MKKRLFKLFIVLLFVVGLGLLYLTNTGVLSFDQPYVFRLSRELPAGTPLVVFKNVNVIPMDSERVLANQTVIVRDGAIEAVCESTRVRVPDGGLIIDGSGKYLMPGLVDMHVHIESENDLVLLVANGVTGIRNMWGNNDKKLWFGLPDQLKLRQQIAQGKLFGPVIYTSGPVMEGSPPNHPLMTVFASPPPARQSVIWQAGQGYDFVKVYDHLSPEVYQAVISAARENNLPVVGHVPFAVGLDGVLANGQQTIEHLTGYINPDTVEFIIPEDQLAAYAEKTHRAGVWNCVTLSEYPKSKETPAGFERLQNQPGMVYVSPGMRLFSPVMYYGASKSHTYPDADYPERIAALNRHMVKALHEAGAGILLGTDAAQAYHIPGFSIHEELAYLVDAGLSPFEALETGTRNAAAAMGKLEEFGTVAAGKRADLILLRQNPLEDVSHVRDRAGVILRGRWLPENELQSILQGLVSSYKPNLFERLWPLTIIALAIFLSRHKAVNHERGLPADLPEVRFAGLRKRLVAFGFDSLIIFAYVLVLLGIGIGITLVIGPLDRIHPLFDSPVFMDIVAFLVLILPVVLYFTLQESSSRQATWGKRKAGIQVVNAGGGRLTVKRAFVRSLLKLLPWQIAHTSIFHIKGWPLAPVEPTPLVMTGFVLVYVLVGIYAVSMLVSKNRRAPYDWAAGSYVISPVKKTPYLLTR